MKIAYVLPSLEKNGGAERIITDKANYFTERFAYDVYIITLFQHHNASNFYPLSNRIHQINLEIPYHRQYRYRYPRRLWEKMVINHRMRQALYRTIHAIDPDIVVGVSYSKADLVCSIPTKAKKIIECHEPRSLIESSIYNGSFISKLFTKYHYFRFIENNADLIITLTPEGKDQWKRAKQVEVIPNYSCLTISGKSTCQNKRVIAVGRLREEKGFERLISIWQIVSSKHPDWQLDIFGEGHLKDELTSIIKTNHVRNISLKGLTNNISKEYATSSICVVTSYFEGFSLAILEAMMHGVPSVAFNCPYGPANIIIDNQCGFLIKNGNNDLFAERLSLLMKDEGLRKKLSHECIKHAKQFDADVIMKQWKDLFENLIQPHTSQFN